MEKTFDTYTIIQYSDGRFVDTYEDIDKDEFFSKVSYIICFDDCSDEIVEEICYKGQLVHYVGWQPDMVYEFADTEGIIVWGGCFPQWDH